MNIGNRFIAGAILVLAIGTVAAASIDEAIRSAAQARVSSSLAIDGHVVDAAYIGEVNYNGEQYAVVALPSRAGKFDRIENFRVCGGRVERVGNVSPSWPGDAQGKALVVSAVQNEIRFGQGQAIYDGYTITARALSTVSSHCKNIDVLISYDGNLVDRAEKQMCQ